LPYELVSEGGILRVVLHNHPVPAGYNVSEVSVNVRIDAGYPDAQIDMAYFHPDLALASGRAIGAVSPDPFDARVWQRWSRHRTPTNPWRPGVDGLATHLALVEEWLQREASKA
jgi:hypothetical protein